MNTKRPRHLQVVSAARRPARPAPESSRADYWAQVRALRDERHRLRAG